MFWFILAGISIVIGIFFAIKEAEGTLGMVGVLFSFTFLLIGALPSFAITKSEISQSHTETLGSEMTLQVDDSPYFVWVDFDGEYHLGNMLTAEVRNIHGSVYVTITKTRNFVDGDFFNYGDYENFTNNYLVEIK